MVFFPAVAVVLYVILYCTAPDKAAIAVKSSRDIFLNMLAPLCLVFAIMAMINLYLKSSKVMQILGKNSGIRGNLLAAVAGIFSAGPIYAWYPLLADLKKKGTGISPVAVFLYSRAFKPFLLPVMMGYFGWEYSVVLALLIVLVSFAIGGMMSALTGNYW